MHLWEQLQLKNMEEHKESFGEYFDAQYDRLRKLLDNKDAQQYVQWMEDYERRQDKKNSKVVG